MRQLLKIGMIVLASVALSACSDNDDDPADTTDTGGDGGGGDGGGETPATAIYDVRIINLTNAQPMSPAAIMFHRSGFNSFIDGETATPALELMAEGGDNADVLSDAQAATQHIVTGSNAAPIGPQSESPAVLLTIPETEVADLHVSVVSMFVHTNDAFTGVNAMNISDLAVGDTKTIAGPVWDAGTELNTETAATIPGPAFSGEGFNVARDDILDLVRFHAGVVSSASPTFGLPTSDLGENYRFLNPGSRIVISRTQ